MNDDELKKKLSVLKSASVPKGYWDSYWPRLRAKISPSSSPAVVGGGSSGVQKTLGPGLRLAGVTARWRWAVPVFALLPILVSVFWLGQRTAEKDILRIPNVRLASFEDDSHAKHVFQEMLQLFPNRVNWITYVDGKVDFSISSVAYKETQPLVPLLVTIPRGKEAFEARVLIRPGQEAAAHAPWMDHATVDLLWRMDALAERVHMSCRLTAPDWSGSVEGQVRLSPNQGTILGALRWRSELLQVQLTRLGETPKASKPQKSTKTESVQI